MLALASSTPTSSPDTLATISLIASIVAIALAVFAIWQASTFYRWSNEASQRIKQSGDEVGESVGKLEVIFNRFYSDTFGMWRDTVTDMRKHIWAGPPGPAAASISEAVKEIEKRADENVERVREEVMAEVRGLAETLGASTKQVSELEDSFRTVLDRAIRGSRAAEEQAIHEVIRSRLEKVVASYRHRGRTQVEADDLLGPLFLEFEPQEVFDSLAAMKEDGLVDWQGDGRITDPAALIAISSAPRIGRRIGSHVQPWAREDGETP